jgi:hypothetical protein
MIGAACNSRIPQANLLGSQETFLIVIKKGNLFAFVNKLQRVTDYLLQKLQTLSEHLLVANFRKIIDYHMQID